MPSSATRTHQTDTSAPRKLGTTVRFLAFGLLNTVVTFSVFVAVGLLVAPNFAYAVSFFLGILIVFKFSNRWVFRGRSSRSANVRYLVWYLAIFSLGQAIIAVAQPEGVRQLLLVSLLLIGLTLPLTYLGGKWIFLRDS